MKIRQYQLDVFRQHASRRHQMRILDFVRQHHPDAVAGLGDDCVLERIRLGLAWVARNGVTDSRAAALFVVLQIAIGPGFHTHPACASVLSRTRLPPDARVMALFDANANIPWDSIKMRRDDSAWSALREVSQP